MSKEILNNLAKEIEQFQNQKFVQTAIKTPTILDIDINKLCTKVEIEIYKEFERGEYTSIHVDKLFEIAVQNVIQTTNDDILEAFYDAIDSHFDYERVFGKLYDLLPVEVLG